MTEQQKHSWTEQELWVVCVCYKENLPVDVALRLTNTKSRKSMEMRYQNCLFLEKGRVENSLSNASKTHVKVWNEVNELYSTLPKIEDPVIPELARVEEPTQEDKTTQKDQDPDWPVLLLILALVIRLFI